ncbi:MAG: TraR/DksA C4-type zinc finger protein [Caldilineales bacterium]|nr:TraR/DksA C4-type zinc finger protein [Caldilineales bacterium]
MATQIQQILRNELDEARQELEQLQQQLEEKPEFGLGTGSTGSFTWEMALARRDRIAARIAEIMEALERAEAGRYGLCETCGKEIDPERLEIVPTATQCIDCARKAAA